MCGLHVVNQPNQMDEVIDWGPQGTQQQVSLVMPVSNYCVPYILNSTCRVHIRFVFHWFPLTLFFCNESKLVKYVINHLREHQRSRFIDHYMQAWNQPQRVETQ